MVERILSKVVAELRISTMVQQEDHKRLVTQLGGDMQRGPSLGVALVHRRRTVPEQRGHDAAVA